MKVSVKIKRFDPNKEKKSYWEQFEAEVEPTDRVLDALLYIKGYIDGSLTLRYSCAHGVCGSDALVINGRNRLACKVLVKDVGKKITVEPLRNLPVVKDLVVDMTGFFDRYKKVMPFLVNNDPVPPKERNQSPEDREKFDDTTKCILCAACSTSCPSYWANDEYVGPATVVAAHRFIFDSRDQAAGERLKVMNETGGVWRCRTVLNCLEACPRDINIPKAIAEVKGALLRGKK